MKHFLQILIEAAQERDLPFLVVGGNAVILLGVPRFTRDIDLLITDKHREAWHQLMNQQDYSLFHRVDAFDQFEPMGKKEEDSRPGVDFMLVDESVWQKLKAAARLVDLAPGLQVPVPDPLHLIAMKLQASQSPHRKRNTQDYSDIVQLFKIFKLGLDQPLILDAVLKYGGPKALADLEKML